MTAYAVLSTLVLLLTGWLAGAESASWALVQPVVARLDATPQIQHAPAFAEVRPRSPKSLTSTNTVGGHR